MIILIDTEKKLEKILKFLKLSLMRNKKELLYMTLVIFQKVEYNTKQQNINILFHNIWEKRTRIFALTIYVGIVMLVKEYMVLYTEHTKDVNINVTINIIK